MMDANECGALVARVRDGGFLCASESDIAALCDIAERANAAPASDRLHSEIMSAALSASERAGRLAVELDAARNRLELESERFALLADLLADATFHVGMVEIDARGFLRADEAGEPDWAQAWREAIAYHASRMQSDEYRALLVSLDAQEEERNNG
jgi:hypothetical protein